MNEYTGQLGTCSPRKKWKIRLMNVKEVGSCVSLLDNLRIYFSSLDDGELVLRLSHHIFMLFSPILFFFF